MWIHDDMTTEKPQLMQHTVQTNLSSFKGADVGWGGEGGCATYKQIHSQSKHVYVQIVYCRKFFHPSNLFHVYWR